MCVWTHSGRRSSRAAFPRLLRERRPVPTLSGLASARRACELVREGLRSGPATGHLGCIWCTEAAGFAAGSRQFADKSAPTKPRYSGPTKRRPVPTSSGRSGFGPEGVCELVREGLRSGPATGHLGCIWCPEAVGFAAGSRQFADKSAPTKPRYSGPAKRRPVPTSSGRSGFGPEGVGADLSAMGCEAALQPVTLVVSGAPRRLVLLPVPGSSRTSPLLQNRDIADQRSVARSVPTVFDQNPKRTCV